MGHASRPPRDRRTRLRELDFHLNESSLGRRKTDAMRRQGWMILIIVFILTILLLLEIWRVRSLPPYVWPPDSVRHLFIEEIRIYRGSPTTQPNNN